ncbi:uncharacterized protein A1O9_03893 [Exophiala aquamarina CBS 119918]|uniref:Major facilitator superfamily (MFS) profile domain-containing protein n=1 Tax=Exophiala aquamarina CBS 119918 TaxID=1182545 RepID=A0A072PU26_9EURO|nr:uncharacterized protein A1O9_03893 [Exophiala aquamarina CBS 119918]KEF59050.1 hypothetical protein A1O9_03893 [Exophiala aquamarina CBS 119918]
MEEGNTAKTPVTHLENVPSQETSVDPAEMGLWLNLKKHPKVAAYCFALTTVILLWGYDMGMTGNLASLPEFQKVYGVWRDDEWIIESRWMGAWNAGSPIGIMLGSLAGGAIQDRWGRRASLGIGSVTSVLGVAVVWCSQYANGSRHGVFLLGKICQGVTIGIAVCTAQTYMSEVLPPAIRAPLVAFFPVFQLVGQLVGAGITFSAEDIEGPDSYRICIISEFPFSALPILLSLLIPESPIYLVRKGRLEEAHKQQKRLDKANVDSRAKIERIQALILHEQEAAKSDRSRYADCFRGTDRRRTVIVLFSAVLPQLFGLPILGDGPYFLQIAGMEASNSLIFLIAGSVGGLLATLISMSLFTRIGRRRLMILTLAPVVVLWLAMGVAGCFDSKVVPWIVGVILNIICFIAGLGVWPGSYVVGGEISSLRLRAKSQGLGWAVGGIGNFVFSTITPFIYNADSGNLRSKIGFVWLGISGLSFLALWFLVPETYGRTPYQLDLMFEQKLPTRKFRHWTPDVNSEMDRIEVHEEKP